MGRKKSVAPRRREFDLEALVRAAGGDVHITDYRRGAAIFSQGDPCRHVLYIVEGAVKLSVLSASGREAVVALLQAGEFFGEGALANQSMRMETATAAAPSRVQAIDRAVMAQLIHQNPEFSDHFISHLLTRTLRVEADLVDQIFNSSEKRLARTLLLLSRYGHSNPEQLMPQISQETLAEMVGTTRSRVNLFMNKFRKLGLIDYGKAGLKVHSSLMNVVLHD